MATLHKYATSAKICNAKKRNCLKLWSLLQEQPAKLWSAWSRAFENAI